MSYGSPSPDIVVLHLSDLHFGPYLQNVGRTGELSYFASPHSYSLLLGLEDRVTKILREHAAHTIVAVTGDLTTAAEPPAYEIVNNYLRDNPYVSDISRVGLKLESIGDRLFFVPGNHDTWLYGDWFTKWKGKKNRKDEYLKYFTHRLPRVYPLIINGISITIYCVDSNQIRSHYNPFNFKNVLGIGEVSDEQRTELQAFHLGLQNGTLNKLPDHYDYETSLKIAIMHHHLALPDGTPAGREQKLLVLKDSERVIDLFCDIGISIVLCGHQHFPYEKPNIRSRGNQSNSILLLCAGSATQIDCDVNSFCVYGIKQNGNRTYNLNLSRFEAHGKQYDYYFKETYAKTFVI